MVRSPLSRRQDETPLTPPGEKTEREVFSSRRESFGLHRISFGGHRHSEIPQNDVDYYPSDVADRELFRESNCDCDCDCTSDGFIGCLRRNKQCFFTVTVLSVTTIIILLIFRSLSYDHKGKYVEDSEERGKWVFHDHECNESHDDNDPTNKRRTIPIIEDYREPYYDFPHYRIIPDATDEGESSRRRRDVDEESGLRGLINDRKSKYEEVLAELNEMEKAMMKDRFSETARTVFEPFSLTSPTTVSWTDGVISDESIDWSDNSKLTDDSFEGGVTDSALQLSSTVAADGGDFETAMPYDPVYTRGNDEEKEFEEDIYSKTIPARKHPVDLTTSSTQRPSTAIDDHNLSYKDADSESVEGWDRSSTEPSIFPKEITELYNGGYGDSAETKTTQGLPVGPINQDETESAASLDRDTSTDGTDHRAHHVQEAMSVPILAGHSSEKPDKMKPSSIVVDEMSVNKDSGKVKTIFETDDRPLPDMDNSYPEAKSEHNPERGGGISLAEAKKKKLQDRKHLLLNSRLVSEVNDIMYPTAPDETKPVVNTVETSKTTQQLSLTPTAFAQYYLPYQMCFYANTPAHGKSSERDAAPKTFRIETPPFFHVPRRTDDLKKSTSYHFPTQQNFLSFNINNFANPGQSTAQFPPSSASVHALPSPHHFAPFLNSAPQPQQQPLFCTYLQPPLFQFPTVSSISETSHPKCVNCDDDGLPVSKEVSWLAGKDLSCLENTVPCKDGSMCVPSVNWCDNKIHCRDGSDEIFCSCRERLAMDRLCDGYLDCPDGEDEKGCFGCPRSTFSCDTFDEPRACIPLSKRCDNIRDCPTGKDETDCAALFPEISYNNSHLVSYSKGFLHRNWKGDWYPVCVEINSNLWAKQACIEEIGFFAGEPKVSFAQISGQYKGPFIVRTGDDSLILQEHCKGHVSTYVRCPAMRCGTRIMSEEYAERRFKRFVQRKGDDFTQWWRRVKKEIMTAYKVDDVFWKLSPVEGGNKGSDAGKKARREETGRVVGGKESEPRAWPWVVALYKNGDFHCGGVILDENWIMTAAHCVEHYSDNYFEIRSGMLRRFSFSPMEQIRTISELVVHEKYNKSIMNNDLALLRMRKPLNFNRWVRPACLPNFGPRALQDPSAGTRCIATGWGAVREHGSNPDQMREVEVPILSRCRHIEDLEGDEICAGVPEGGKDTCQGDSGGPLLCRDFASSWYVAGIVSHGEGCARPGEPGAYTRVSIFMDWITANSNDFQLPAVKPVIKCPGFRCTSGSRRCISSKWVCNGLTDCLNGEDELDCNKGTSPIGRSADDDKYAYTVTLMQKNSSSPFEEEGQAKKNGSAQTPVVRSLDKAGRLSSFIAKPLEVYDEFSGSTKAKGLETQAQGDIERITQGKLTTLHFVRNDEPEVTSVYDEVKDVTRADFPQESRVKSDGGGRTHGVLREKPVITATERIAVDGSSEGTTVSENEEIEPRMRSEVTESDNSVGYIRNYNRPNATTPEVYHCRDIIQAVKETYHCDGIVDCEDATDESLCKCRDHLLKTRPELICNGVVDCPDLSDEKQCYSCSKKEFNCMVSNQCLPKFKRCDDVKDCAFGEDETDCYALAKNDKIRSDKTGKPLLRLKGKLMVKKGGVWSPYCQKNDAMKAAARTCLSLGSSGYEKYENGSDSTHDCRTLHVECSKRLTTDMGYYSWYDDGYRWPWHSFLYSDGKKICSAALLEVNWLIADFHCFEHVSLHKNHVIAKLGSSRAEADAWLEHGTQLVRVDGVKRVHNSDIILIHLSKPVTVTWQVRPISMPYWSDVSSKKELCVAVADETIFLRSLPSSDGSYRSYSLVDESGACWPHHRSMSKIGVIACQSHAGWYPASVFHEKNNFCHRDRYFYGNILEKIRDIKSAIDSDIKLLPELACDGVRCSEGSCIPEDQVCDGRSDCPAREDEDFATCSGRRKSECRSHELRCSNGNCVPKRVFNNGVDECGDGSDEPGVQACVDYLRLTSPERICDGVANCYDKTDELPGACNCTDAKFACTLSNDTCIPRDFVCDGTKDCPDGEDEDACVGFRRVDPHGNKKEIEIIHMSYGVWHSLCSPSITRGQADEVCRELGYGRAFDMSLRNQTQISPLLDAYSAVKLNMQTSILLRSDRPFARAAEDGFCEVVVVKCE